MSLLELNLPKQPRPIVLIGAGGIVRDAHLPAYRKAAFKVASIFDLDQERARSLARTFGVDRVPASIENAVSSAPVDAIFDVATPPSAFLDILKCLPDRSGVLIQKPMGENLSHARQSKRATKRLSRKRVLTLAVTM